MEEIDSRKTLWDKLGGPITAIALLGAISIFGHFTESTPKAVGFSQPYAQVSSYNLHGQEGVADIYRRGMIGMDSAITPDGNTRYTAKGIRFRTYEDSIHVMPGTVIIKSAN